MENKILDFCFVVLQNGCSLPIMDHLKEYGMKPQFCGLSRVKRTNGLYAVYYDKIEELKSKGVNLGVCSVVNFCGIEEDPKNPYELKESKIIEGELPVFIMYYDKEGYKISSLNYPSIP